MHGLDEVAKNGKNNNKYQNIFEIEMCFFYFYDFMTDMSLVFFFFEFSYFNLLDILVSLIEREKLRFGSDKIIQTLAAGKFIPIFFQVAI